MTKKTATMRREDATINVNGNFIPFRNRWVLRDSTGKYLDHDQYRHDICERFGNDYDITIIDVD